MVRPCTLNRLSSLMARNSETTSSDASTTWRRPPTFESELCAESSIPIPLESTNDGASEVEDEFTDTAGDQRGELRTHVEHGG